MDDAASGPSWPIAGPIVGPIVDPVKVSFGHGFVMPAASGNRLAAAPVDPGVDVSFVCGEVAASNQCVGFLTRWKTARKIR